MRRMLVAALALLPTMATAADIAVPPEARRELGLSIYNDDLAVVRDRREVTMPTEDNRVTFTGLSRRILAQSARISGDGLTVGEQDVAVQPVTTAALLPRLLGQEVTLLRPANGAGGETAVRARLLGADGPILEIDGRVEVAPPGRLVFDHLPAGMAAEPSLAAVMHATPAGRHLIDITYLTNGVSWQGEYRIDLSADETTADLGAWAVVTNNSGMAFRDADVALIAGQVHHVAAPGGPQPMRAAMAAAPAAPAAEGAAQEELAGYAVYKTHRPLTIEAGQIKEVSLFSAANVTARRELVVDPPLRIPVFRQQLDPVETRPSSVLVLGGKAGLVAALPAGVARVFKRDQEGVAQFVGDDRAAQKAKGEPLRILLGEDSEVTVTRVQTAFHGPHPGDDTSESAWEVKLVNHKAKPVSVRVRDLLPVNGKVVEESLPHEQGDPRSLAWVVDVAAGGEAHLTYKVRADAH